MPTSQTVAAFAQWVRSHPTGEHATPEEAELLLDLLDNHLGVDDPGALQPSELEELMLEVYPQKVMVAHPEDLDAAVPTARALVEFLAQTKQIPARRSTELQRTLDRIEPRFVDAVMDPSRWGVARTIAAAMVRDGVDLTDDDASSQWIARYNSRLGGFDALGGPPEDDRIDLKEALELPDRLPPLRLPLTSELADAARSAPLIAQVDGLAGWLTERPRSLRSFELATSDAVAAARAIGVEVPTRAADENAFPGLPAVPDVARMADLSRLMLVWRLAEVLEVIEIHETAAALVSGAETWTGFSDEAVLEDWNLAFGHLATWSTPCIDGAEQPWDADDGGIGAVLLTALYLAGEDGITVDGVRETLQEAVDERRVSAAARQASRSWTARHGDPAELWLRALSDLGAITVQDGTVRLTALAKQAVRLQLLDADVEVPLLPSPETMTAADIVMFAASATQDELAVEWNRWLELSGPESASEDLLALAGAGSPSERMIATSLTLRLGEVAEERWRRALDEPALRPYAKLALSQLDGRTDGEFPPDIEPTLSDMAWIVTDTIAATADAMDSEDLRRQLATTVPPDQGLPVLEQIWRMDHPCAHDVLMTIGRHHPDKAVAKAARKAAYKTTTSIGTHRQRWSAGSAQPTSSSTQRGRPAR